MDTKDILKLARAWSYFAVGFVFIFLIAGCVMIFRGTGAEQGFVFLLLSSLCIPLVFCFMLLQKVTEHVAQLEARLEEKSEVSTEAA